MNAESLHSVDNTKLLYSNTDVLLLLKWFTLSPKVSICVVCSKVIYFQHCSFLWRLSLDAEEWRTRTMLNSKNTASVFFFADDSILLASSLQFCSRLFNIIAMVQVQSEKFQVSFASSKAAPTMSTVCKNYGAFTIRVCEVFEIPYSQSPVIIDFQIYLFYGKSFSGCLVQNNLRLNTGGTKNGSIAFMAFYNSFRCSATFTSTQVIDAWCKSKVWVRFNKPSTVKVIK